MIEQRMGYVVKRPLLQPARKPAWPRRPPCPTHDGIQVSGADREWRPPCGDSLSAALHQCFNDTLSTHRSQMSIYREEVSVVDIAGRETYFDSG